MSVPTANLPVDPLLQRLRSGIVTGSAAATRSLATELAQILPADTTLALHGDMGVGKTTFVQGLGRGLGVREPITSPTFAIYAVHRGAERVLVHLDAYRLTNGRQVEDLLLDEFLASPWLLAVEWPGHTGTWLPADAWHLSLSIVDGDQHRVQLTKP